MERDQERFYEDELEPRVEETAEEESDEVDDLKFFLELLKLIRMAINAGANVPLTNKKIIDADKCLRIIDDMEKNLPDAVQYGMKMYNERSRIMNNAETDPAVRAIIVTGTGKVFCAGEDLSELSEGGECQTVTEHGFGGLTARVCSKPIIAAVNGSAAGGGMEIAISCDIVVANENAKFGCTEVGLGIIASTGGIVRLARDINRKDCMELLLTGKKIKAPEAKELGLINYAVPADEVMDLSLIHI